MCKRYLTRIIFSYLVISLLLITVAAASIPYQFITIDDYVKAKDQIILLDTRSTISRAGSGIEVAGAIWIDPYQEKTLEDFITIQDKTKSYAVFCSCVDDNYSIRAAQILTKRGFTDVKVLKGGWDSIQNSDLNLVKIKGDDK